MPPEINSSAGSEMAASRSPTAFPGQMKEFFTALREGVILIVLVLALLWPSQIGRIAEAAGLKSAFGLEFREQAEETQKQTEAAQAAMSEYQNGLTQIGQQLQALSQQPQGPAQASVRRLATSVDSLKIRGTAVNKSLETSLLRQREILKRIPR